MIDLHSHILPGLDDGARDIDDALGIARAAVADGTTVLAATPHVRDDYPTTAAQMQAALADVERALAENDLRLRVVPGAEISLTWLERLSAEDFTAFGLGGNPGYLLLETPYHGWPIAFADIVAQLRERGITAVIAHPERNADVQSNPDLLRGLVGAGALVQVTAASLDGRLGRTPRACVERLLDVGIVHLLASDAHNPGIRSVGLSKARAAVGDEGLARWLTESVPRAIVEGTPIPPRPPRMPRRGVLRRLRL